MHGCKKTAQVLYIKAYISVVTSLLIKNIWTKQVCKDQLENEHPPFFFLFLPIITNNEITVAYYNKTYP